MAKRKLTALSDLQPAPYNPRRISDESLAALRKSVTAFGDLSGIVWNSRTGHLVAGHQRYKALQAEHGDGLTLVDGALLTPSGERFPVRVVDWPEGKEKAANVAANSELIAGEFTDGLGALLDEIKVDLGELFEELRLDIIIPPTFNPDDHWQGMPEFNQKEIEGNAICCMIRCKTEDDMKAFEKHLGWKLQHKGKLYSSWYPQTDYDQQGRGKVFINES